MKKKIIIWMLALILLVSFASAGNWNDTLIRSDESGDFILWDMFENASSGYNTTLWDRSAGMNGVQDNVVFVEGSSSMVFAEQGSQDNIRLITTTLPEIPVFDFYVRKGLNQNSNFVLTPDITFGSFNGNQEIKCGGAGTGVNMNDEAWYHVTLVYNDSSTGTYNLYLNGAIICNGTSTLTNSYTMYFGDNAGDGLFNANYDNFTYGNISAWSETPPPASDTLNISGGAPATNHQTNSSNLILDVVVSSNNTFDCDLYINGSLNASNNSNTAGTDKTINFDVTFDDAYYSWYVECDDGQNPENSTTKNLFIDTTPPQITSESIDGTYWTNYYNLSLTVQDNLNLLYFNWSDTCSKNYSNGSITINPFPYTNDSMNITGCGIGTQTMDVEVCDGPNGTTLNCITAEYTYYTRGRLNITAKDYNGTSISSFDVKKNGTLMGSTTTGYFHIDNLTAGDYEITFDSADYELKSANITVSSAYTNHQFTLYTTNSFNFTFLDENTEAVISGTNITVEFIGDTETYTYSTITGLLYVDLLTPQHYTIRYTANQTYQPNHYETSLSNRSHTEISLYMTNSSDDITVTVYDQITLNTIEGAVVYIQKYYHSTGSFKIVSMGTTDPAGKIVFYVEEDTEYYKFLVDYPYGTSKLVTEKFYITQANINLYISLSDDVAEDFFDAEGITAQLSFDDATREFIATWVDSELVATEYCFYVKEYGYYGKTIHNSSCTTSPSGSIALAVPATNSTYYAVFTAKISGEEIIIASVWKELLSDTLNAGAFGLFLTAMLVMIFSFLSIFHIMALIFANVALILAKLLGIFPLGWGQIITIMIASLIIGIIIEMKK